MGLFKEQITNWEEWGGIFQSIPAFTPLVEHIFIKEKLPLVNIENLTPGTNAVFKVGGYVIKIFAPSESGIDQSLDLQTELFATSRANNLGISAPKLITHGFIEDKYRFAYMITEYIQGTELEEAVKVMTDCEKTDIARKLRSITDKMNTHCEPFNGVDVINDKGRYRRWDKYPECFRAERVAYIKSYDYGEKVFVHGDLCLDNILLTPQGELYIIDFADAVLAPKIYEHALLVSAFNFDSALLRGYFNDYSSEEFTEMCFNGLLIHDFGGDIVEELIGNISEIQGLEDLRKRLKRRLEALLRASSDIIFHYDALIDENNDPVHDPEPLKSYMNKWDGESFIEAMRLTPDKSVLEIGVGTGRLAERVCKRCGSFTGVDISPKTVERAEENLYDYQNIRLICGDFLTHTFTETFDVIYSSLTFMHINDKQTAIQKAAGLLNPDGRFVLSVSKDRRSVIDFGSRRIEIYPDSAEEIASLLIKTGLSIENKFETEFAVIFAARKGKGTC